MGTITCLVKTKELYGSMAICCGPEIISDNLVFIPEKVFGSVQALFSSSNVLRVKQHFLDDGVFENINDGDPYFNSRQYVFFIEDKIKVFTGDRVKSPYVFENENIVLCGNRVGDENFMISLFDSLCRNYTDDLESMLTKSFKENKFVGFDYVCKDRGVSSTTLCLRVYSKKGKLICGKDLYHNSKDVLDL